VEYPFDLPEKVTATLNVDTAQKKPVNHMLLGLNCNWPENLYGKVGYNHPRAQSLIKQMKPTSLRFPHGVWANFYDWESDGRRITDDYKTPYDSAVKDHPDLKYGFDGFHRLHQELKFDVLLTFNVNYDSPRKAARRLADRRSKGFDTKWIELGNEIFWKTQRSRAVVDIEKYIEVSQAHAAALKAVDPEVLVSIPAHWRTAETNPWNLAVKQHDYYDAITLHKHMGNSTDRAGAAATLNARHLMVQTGETLRRVFPEGNR
jgi:alpha-L-arabinofuranosidase